MVGGRKERTPGCVSERWDVTRVTFKDFPNRTGGHCPMRPGAGMDSCCIMATSQGAHLLSHLCVPRTTCWHLFHENNMT